MPSIIPKNGAFTATGYLADFASMDITSGQSVENVTPYGANTMSKNVGNGTPDMGMNVGAFALKGQVSLVSLSAAGVSTVATLDTGNTLTGTFVVENIRLSHARMRAATPLAFSLRNGGDVTEVLASA